jgi:hypothetical protein
MAIIMGVAMIYMLGISNTGLIVAGDNTTSLAWTGNDTFSSGYSSRAAIVYCQLLIKSKLRVNETIHIPGEFNIICDQLSRGVRPEDLGYCNAHIMVINDYPFLKNCLMLCSPLEPLYDNLDLFTAFWNKVNEFTEQAY